MFLKCRSAKDKTVMNKDLFLTDDSLFKILYLIGMDALEKCIVPLQNWGTIMNLLQVYFGERLEIYRWGE